MNPSASIEHKIMLTTPKVLASFHSFLEMPILAAVDTGIQFTGVSKTNKKWREKNSERSKGKLFQIIIIIFTHVRSIFCCIYNFIIPFLGNLGCLFLGKMSCRESSVFVNLAWFKWIRWILLRWILSWQRGISPTLLWFPIAERSLTCARSWWHTGPTAYRPPSMD